VLGVELLPVLEVEVGLLVLFAAEGLLVLFAAEGLLLLFEPLSHLS